jgi:hypothetical protein
MSLIKIMFIKVQKLTMNNSVKFINFDSHFTKKIIEYTDSVASMDRVGLRAVECFALLLN